MIETYKKYLLLEINSQPFYSEIFLIILVFFLVLLILSVLLIAFVSYTNKTEQKEKLLQLERKLLRLKESYALGSISDVEYKNRVQLLRNNIKI